MSHSSDTSTPVLTPDERRFSHADGGHYSPAQQRAAELAEYLQAQGLSFTRSAQAPRLLQRHQISMRHEVTGVSRRKTYTQHWAPAGAVRVAEVPSFLWLMEPGVHEVPGLPLAGCKFDRHGFTKLTEGRYQWLERIRDRVWLSDVLATLPDASFDRLIAGAWHWGELPSSPPDVVIGTDMLESLFGPDAIRCDALPGAVGCCATLPCNLLARLLVSGFGVRFDTSAPVLLFDAVEHACATTWWPTREAWQPAGATHLG